MVSRDIRIYSNFKNDMRHIFAKRPINNINNYNFNSNILKFRKKLLKNNIINNKKIAA